MWDFLRSSEPWREPVLRGLRQTLSGELPLSQARIEDLARGCAALATASVEAEAAAHAAHDHASRTNWPTVIVFSLLALAALAAYHHLGESAHRHAAPLETAEQVADEGAPVEVLALFCNPTLPEQAARAGLHPLAFGQDLKALMHALPRDELEVEPAATLLHAHQALVRCAPRYAGFIQACMKACARTRAHAHACMHAHVCSYLVFSGHTIMGALAFETPDGRLDLQNQPDFFIDLLAGLQQVIHACTHTSTEAATPHLSPHLTSHLTSPLTSPHLTSPHLSPHLTSPHLTPHLTSPDLTPHLTSPDLRVPRDPLKHRPAVAFEWAPRRVSRRWFCRRARAHMHTHVAFEWAPRRLSRPWFCRRATSCRTYMYTHMHTHMHTHRFTTSCHTAE